MLSVAAAAMAVGMMAACARPDPAPVAAAAVKASAQPAVATAALSPGASAAPTDLPPPSATYIAECLDDNLVQHPKTLTLTCADGNESLENLKWTGWAQKEARATGQISTNTCTPSCAQGTIQRFPVSVVAEALDQREASEFYTKLTVTYTGDRPAGVNKTEVYELPAPPK